MLHSYGHLVSDFQNRIMLDTEMHTHNSSIATGRWEGETGESVESSDQLVWCTQGQTRDLKSNKVEGDDRHLRLSPDFYTSARMHSQPTLLPHPLSLTLPLLRAHTHTLIPPPHSHTCTHTKYTHAHTHNWFCIFALLMSFFLPIFAGFLRKPK